MIARMSSLHRNPSIPTRATRSRAFGYRFLLVAVLVWVAVTGVAALTGPFSTHAHLPTGEKFAYWGLVVGIAILLSFAALPLRQGMVQRGWNRWAIDVVMIALFSAIYVHPLDAVTRYFAGDMEIFAKPIQAGIIVAVAVFLVLLREAAVVFFVTPDPAAEAGALGLPYRAAVPVSGPVPVTVTAAAPGLAPRPASLAERLPLASPLPPAAAEAPEALCPLLERVPGPGIGALWAISSDNHYVALRGSQGTHSVLLRFSDALRETGAVAGAQVHRSHWVADAAVASLRRDGARATLVLHDGHEIPVSRSFVAGVLARWQGLA